MAQGGFGGNPFDGPAASDPFAGAPVPGDPPSAPPPAPPPGPARTETNTLATLSVVFAFVFAPAGAILGHVGLAQIARTGQRGRDRALTGITLSYVLITVAVVALVVWAATGGNDAPQSSVAAPPATTTTTTTTSTKPSPPPPPAPTVDAAALPGVLIPLIDLRTLIGDPGQQTLHTSEAPETPPNDGGTFDDDSCMPSFVSGIPAAYEGTNWRTFHGSDSANQQNGLQVGQAAARFDDAAAAQKALGGYLDRWRACGGKTTRWALPDGRTVTVTFGTPRAMGNGMTMLTNTVSDMAAPAVFTRIIATKANVLLDNSVTGIDLGDIPTKLTQAMLDRVTPR